MVKRWAQQISLGAIFALLMVFITALLRLSLSWSTGGTLLSSLYNLYYVPILLGAVFLGETGCVILAILAAAGTSVVDHGFHCPQGLAEWWSIAIRGAFFLTLGYLASHFADRLRANSRNWQSLLEISRAISSSLDLDETLQNVTQKSVELTSADACAIRLLSEDDEELLYAKSFGLSDKYLAKGPTRIKDEPIIQHILRGRELVVRDVRKFKDGPYYEETQEEGIISIMSVPLCVEDRVIGLLNLYRKRYVRFNNRDIRIARAFAEQVAIALQNARLYASIRKNYLDTVRALTRAVEARDSLTHGHSERVAEYAVAMAKAMELSPEEIQTIEFGALLHDLGKISLDEHILLKIGNLTVDEQVMLEMHPMIGKSILDPVEFLRPAIPILLYHHERWDGHGYPERLAGDAVPLLARIVAVANGFDQLMYRSSPFPLPVEDVMLEMRKEAGAAYDPQLVELLATTLAGETQKTADQS